MIFARFVLSVRLLLSRINPSLLRFLVVLRLLETVERILLLSLLGKC